MSNEQGSYNINKAPSKRWLKLQNIYIYALAIYISVVLKIPIILKNYPYNNIVSDNKSYYNSFSGRFLAIITNLLRVNITSPGVNSIISPVFLPAFENGGLIIIIGPLLGLLFDYWPANFNRMCSFKQIIYTIYLTPKEYLH